MKKLLATIGILSLFLLQTCGALPVLAADPDAEGLKVNFTVLSMDPAGATVRAEIFSQVDRTVEYQLLLDNEPLGVTAVTVTTRLEIKEKPVYSMVTLTDKEKLAIGAALLADTGAVLPLSAKTDAEKLSYIKQQGIEIPDTDFKQTSVQLVERQVEDKKPLATYTDFSRATSAVDVKAGIPTIIDFTVKQPVTLGASGYQSYNILSLIINGKEYKDLTNSSWWSASWLYSMELTFDNSASAENLIDFPVLVRLEDGVNCDFADFQNDGGDIRFIDADGSTVLAYEIEGWDVAGVSYLWVKVPQIDAGSVTDYITLYYGNTTVANGQTPADVWNSGYAAVYHLNDATTSTILDSTSNNNDGAKKAAGEPVEAAGAIGSGQTFDGNDDYILVADSASLNLHTAGLITIEAFVKPNTFPATTERIVAKHNGTSTRSFDFGIESTAKPTFFTAASGVTSTRALADGNWQNTAVSFTDPGNSVIFYLDGVSEAGIAMANVFSNTTGQPMVIGNFSGLARNFKGTIDELRISNVVRSADWVEATYLSNTDALISYGSQQGIPVLSTLAADNVVYTAGWSSSGTATLRGELTDMGTSATVELYFEFGRTIAFELGSTKHWTVNAVTPFGYQLKELDKGTYYYRAATDCTFGTFYGNTETFTLAGTGATAGMFNLLPLLSVVALLGLWGAAIFKHSQGLFISAIIGTVVILLLLPVMLGAL